MNYRTVRKSEISRKTVYIWKYWKRKNMRYCKKINKVVRRKENRLKPSKEIGFKMGNSEGFSSFEMKGTERPQRNGIYKNRR